MIDDSSMKFKNLEIKIINRIAIKLFQW